MGYTFIGQKAARKRRKQMKREDRYNQGRNGKITVRTVDPTQLTRTENGVWVIPNEK